MSETAERSVTRSGHERYNPGPIPNGRRIGAAHPMHGAMAWPSFSPGDLALPIADHAAAPAPTGPIGACSPRE